MQYYVVHLSLKLATHASPRVNVNSGNEWLWLRHGESLLLSSLVTIIPSPKTYSITSLLLGWLDAPHVLEACLQVETLQNPCLQCIV